jgi:hypothetical protein
MHHGTQLASGRSTVNLQWSGSAPVHACMHACTHAAAMHTHPRAIPPPPPHPTRSSAASIASILRAVPVSSDTSSPPEQSMSSSTTPVWRAARSTEDCSANAGVVGSAGRWGHVCDINPRTTNSNGVPSPAHPRAHARPPTCGRAVQPGPKRRAQPHKELLQLVKRVLRQRGADQHAAHGRGRAGTQRRDVLRVVVALLAWRAAQTGRQQAGRAWVRGACGWVVGLLVEH